MSREQLKPKEILELGLRLRATAKPENNYTLFFHIVDVQGRRTTGHDSEPFNGLSPTSQWEPGQEVETRHGLQIPPSLPSGTYYLEIGLYHQPRGRRLTVLDKAGRIMGDAVSLGPVIVEGELFPGEGTFHPTNLSFGEKVTLLGYTIVDEQWRPGDVKRIETPTGTIVLTFPAPGLKIGQDLRLSLHWRAEDTLNEDLGASFRIIDPQGKVRA